jgi:hypothetical protein
MAAVSIEFLSDQLDLADELEAGRSVMFEPQDLPGRFGRLVKAVDRVLSAAHCAALLAGGWAVWRHGYVGRVTQDLDIILAADQIDEFLRVAAVSGFEILETAPGRWPKVRHKDTDLQVDILPEGGRPGTAARPAPTTIPSPAEMDARPGLLQYLALPYLIELKLAAGRARDDSDIIELLRVNPDQVNAVRNHLESIHADYVSGFDKLLERAREQQDA